MRSQSWYELEKDRIVITDLDDSDDGSDDGIDAKLTSGIDISPALLDRIKGHRVRKIMPVPLPNASTALVLFRPLTYGRREVVENAPAKLHTQSSPLDDDAPLDNYAMDIEP